MKDLRTLKNVYRRRMEALSKLDVIKFTDLMAEAISRLGRRKTHQEYAVMILTGIWLAVGDLPGWNEAVGDRRGGRIR
jgi:hypothetical protein